MSNTLFLRRVLALDALSCLAMGLGLTLAAAPLAGLFGLPEPLLRLAGLALLPIGLFIGWLASRPLPPRWLVWLVIVGNLGWTAESFILLGQHGGTVTGLGTAFASAQALAVLGFSGLEYLGLNKAARAAA